MRVLLVKTSSLGDLIHTLPALSDAARAMPGIRFDWLVEEGFAEVPAWHPAVAEVIPIAMRRWRKAWLKSVQRGELGDFMRRLRQTRYDLVIDAQGLIKSALPARLARGALAGLDRRSAREPLAALFYNHGYRVIRQQHAIERTRRLFAAALGYDLDVDTNSADFGLHFSAVRDADSKRLMILHGTTWPSKHWPEPYWAELVHIASAEGFDCVLPWGDPDDRLRAERIIGAAASGRLLARQSLTELAQTLASASGVVGVDSGLAHLAAAVGVPAITLYGPTRTELTGVVGAFQHNLSARFVCAPCMQRECTYRGPSMVEPACFEQLAPRQVYAALLSRMEAAAG